MFPEYDLKM